MLPLKPLAFLPIFLAVFLAFPLLTTASESALLGLQSHALANDSKPLIESITFSSRADEPLADDSFVRSFISTKVGTPINSSLVAEDVRRLLDTQRFSYVGTKISTTQQGVHLTFVIENRLRIGSRITFSGMKKFGESKALNILKLHPGDSVDNQVVQTAAKRLEQEYRALHFSEVAITPQLTPYPNNPQVAKLHFTVQEGKRSKVHLIQFPGASVIPARRLRRFSGQSPWWNPSGWFAQVKVNDYDLEIVKADIRKQYFDKGYLDVQIEGPIKSSPSPQHQAIEFKITEGQPYHIASIDFEGITKFPTSTVARVLSIAAGDVASYAKLNESRQAVRNLFTSQGYIRTQVAFNTFPGDEPNTIHVTFHVDESAQASVRNIFIRGNTATKDKVIRREILLNPGDIFNGVIADRSQRRLQNMGYFESVRYYDAPVNPLAEEKNSAEAVAQLDERDVFYEVAEKSTGSLMLGFGYSSVDHLIGMFEISQSNFDITNFRNFRGAGQKARLSLQIASDSSNLEASFIEPWFLDRRLSLEVDAFIRNRSYSEYDQRFIGFSTGLSRHVPMIGRMGLTYQFQQARLSDLFADPLVLADDPTTAYSYLDEDDAYYLGSLRLSWTYDTRNNPMVPSAGTRANIHGSLYHTLLGSDYDLYEADLRFRNYQPLWYRHVLSFYLRASVIDAFSDDDVPLASRYFMGGGRTIRGFRHRAVGPKALVAADSSHYHPIGGQTRLEATVEYTIPVVKFLRLAAFYDIGNVWNDPWDFDFNELASSVGGGIRLDIPGFPIRFDYATALEKDDDLSRERQLVFWIGFDD